jgi:hypothetical protein
MPPPDSQDGALLSVVTRSTSGVTAWCARPSERLRQAIIDCAHHLIEQNKELFREVGPPVGNTPPWLAPFNPAARACKRTGCTRSRFSQGRSRHQRTGIWAADPITKGSSAINTLVKFAATLLPDGGNRQARCHRSRCGRTGQGADTRHQGTDMESRMAPLRPPSAQGNLEGTVESRSTGSQATWIRACV